MSGREIATFAIITLYTLFVYISRGMNISIKGISLMAWLIVGLYFLAPIVSLIFLYLDKEKGEH